MKVIFKPKTKSIEDILLTAQARRIWEEQQGDIVDAMQQASGLSYQGAKVYATTGAFNDTHSGWPGRVAMSLPLQTFYGETGERHYRPELQYLETVTHELGHRLLLEHGIVAPPGSSHDVEAHQHLFLFLLDAWEKAYGADCAQKLIDYELQYDKPSGYIHMAIEWAQKLSKKQRHELMTYLINNRCLPQDARLIMPSSAPVHASDRQEAAIAS